MDEQIKDCVDYLFFNTNDSIQFNSKTLYKDGDPVSSQLIFPRAIQTCEQYNNCSYIYIFITSNPFVCTFSLKYINCGKPRVYFQMFMNLYWNH